MNFSPENIVIFGGCGAIARALKNLLSERYPSACLTVFSSKGPQGIDYTNEESLSLAAKKVTEKTPLDLVIVTNGILHNEKFMPEKSLQELTAEKFRCVFEINTIVPALIAKHFIPKLNKNRLAIFACLSARVGSISDNRLGGWYAYRASKSALNMIIKNSAIEANRRNKNAIIIGLHPGTVDSKLSKPFQSNVSAEKLFTPEYSAEKLLKVLKSMTTDKTGKCFAWDGKEILP